MVEDAAFFGTHHRVRLIPAQAPGVRFIAYLPQTRTVSPGDRIRMRLDASLTVVLAREEA